MNTATREINKDRISLNWFFFFTHTTALLFITTQLVCMYCYFHACEFCGVPEPPAACLTSLKCEQPLLKDEAWISAMERATDHWITHCCGPALPHFVTAKTNSETFSNGKRAKTLTKQVLEGKNSIRPMLLLHKFLKRLNKINSQHIYIYMTSIIHQNSIWSLQPVITMHFHLHFYIFFSLLVQP